MLYINPASPNVTLAQKRHLKILTCYVNKKLDEPICTDPKCEICPLDLRKVNNLSSKIKNFLTSNNCVEQVLIGSPRVLETLNISFWQHIFHKHTLADLYPYFKDISSENLRKKDPDYQRRYKIVNHYSKQIKSIFNYDWFNSKTTLPYNSFHLCKSLDRYTCTYCNRSYTSTIVTDQNKMVSRPTLDHWFPKSKFALLSISFFNLIPSCYSCNSSVKGTGNLSLTTSIHPYKDANQSDDFEFDYSYKSLKGFRIHINDTPSGAIADSKAKNTLESMYIDEVYNSNISELRDLLIIKRNYSASYINIMQSLLKTKMTKSEVFRILFGVMYEQQHFHKRPLSKFKKDILKKLEMLDNI